MAEYIEREAFLEFCDKRLPKMVADPDGLHPISLEVVMVAIKNWPAADVAPVVHGRWEFIGNDYANCTNCGTIFETRPTPYFFSKNNKFCRNCGARMDGE